MNSTLGSVVPLAMFTDGPCLWENFALEKQEQEMDEEREHKSKDLKMLP